MFNRLHHVCIVVRDVATAAAYYASIGIGPWRDYPPMGQYSELDVPDAEAFRRASYKFADIANVQIQLCQPGAGDSPQGRFLQTHGEGVFHLGFDVPDCDVSEESARADGLSILMRGRRADRSGFTFFDTADAAGVVLEIRSSPAIVGTKA